MTSNLNPKPSAQNLPPSGQTPPSAIGGYSPSVPISVYRELAAELQATRVMLDSLNSQNQQLTQHNQLLRREIEKVVNASLHLQQLADSSVSVGWSETSYTHPELKPEPRQAMPGSRPATRRSRPASGGTPANPTVEVSSAFQEGQPELPLFSEKLVTEQAEGRYRRRSQPERSADVNGWWITLVIALIVITAFGAGFMIMRPLILRR